MSFDRDQDPASGVLRNRLGIVDANELADAESDYSAFRLAQIARGGLPREFAPRLATIPASR